MCVNVAQDLHDCTLVVTYRLKTIDAHVPAIIKLIITWLEQKKHLHYLAALLTYCNPVLPFLCESEVLQGWTKTREVGFCYRALFSCHSFVNWKKNVAMKFCKSKFNCYWNNRLKYLCVFCIDLQLFEQSFSLFTKKKKQQNQNQKEEMLWHFRGEYIQL